MKFTNKIVSDDHNTNRFTTYLHYLTAIKNYLDCYKNNPEELLQPVAVSPKFSAIKNNPQADHEKIAKLLRNAWATELQIHLIGDRLGHYAHTNHWIPVQVYYSIYLALRAYIHINDPAVDGQHTGNLRNISEQIKSRPALFPYPWKMLCVHTSDGLEYDYLNLPNDTAISKISSLQAVSDTSFWDSYAMFLRTTRERQIKGQIENIKKTSHIESITKENRCDIQRDWTPTNLFHGLYRLRLRSNYGDADSFWMVDVPHSDGKAFHSALESITWNSLLMFELLIARQIGKKPFTKIVDGFTAHDKEKLAGDHINKRWEIIKPLW